MNTDPEACSATPVLNTIAPDPPAVPDSCVCNKISPDVAVVLSPDTKAIRPPVESAPVTSSVVAPADIQI